MVYLMRVVLAGRQFFASSPSVTLTLPFSTNNTPHSKTSAALKRKRTRSMTPNSRAGSDSGEDTGSPLSKRKKIAAERLSASRFKEGAVPDRASTNDSRPQSPAGDYDDEESVASIDADLDDDFLADALEEELG